MELPLLLQIPSWSIMSRNEPPGFENCSARSAQLQFAVLTFFCLPLPWVPQGWGKTRMSQQEISASPLTVPWEIGCLTGLEWSHETISWASFGIYSMFSAHTCVATVQLMFHHFGLLFPEGHWGVLSCSSQGSSRFYFLPQLGCHHDSASKDLIGWGTWVRSEAPQPLPHFLENEVCFPKNGPRCHNCPKKCRTIA